MVISDKKKLLKAGAIVIAVLLVLSVASYKFGNFSPLGIGRGLSNLTDGVISNDGYPYKASAGDIEYMTMSYNDLALLNDTSLKVVDRTGRTVSDFPHNYSSPLLYTYGNNMLVLDAGGNKFRLQTSGKIVYENEFGFELLAGDVSKNGSVAIASKSDKGASMLTVFDSKHKEVFSWVCAKQQIVSVDISENGKYIAVGVIGAESGDIVSDVYLFDINYKDALTSLKFPGTAVAKVEILTGKRLLVIGDNLITFVNSKGERNDIDVSLDTVSRFYVSDNNISAIVLSKYSSAYANILKIYSSSGKEISSADIDFQINGMCSDGKHIALLTDGKLVCYDLYGRVSGEKTIENDAVSCCVYGNDVYVLFSNRIDKFSVRGVTDERETQTPIEKVDEEVIKN